MSFAAHHHWPDALDLATTCLLLGGILALTLSGHVLFVLDVRAWLRTFRRALIVVTDHLPNFPRWVRLQTPRCLAAMGLKLPCNEEQLMRTYRQKVKQLHPDCGGDRKRFMRLQANFEEALQFIRNQVRDGKLRC
ncbi:MAG TPA: J domain-containing protein [Pirellulales bacterium]|nr:J domain-containing protein [Pirellulales bacterium]